MEAVKDKFSAVVIGGVNMDIEGRPYARLISKDSNPGFVAMRPGGVGRNIAHDLCLLGMDVGLIAALGKDIYGESIMSSCEKLGIDMSMCTIIDSQRSSVYLYISDDGGDMQLAIADMEIVKRLTPEYLSDYMDKVNTFDALVLDANPQQESLQFAAEHADVPIYADPVSTAKAVKFLPILERLTAIKPNAIEAQILTGEKDMERAAKVLISKGVKRVFISLGMEGMLAAEGDKIIQLPRENVKVVNTTGAGDAAMAAIVWAGTQGADLVDTARAAIKAGALTCQSDQANSEKLSEIILGQ